MRALMVELTRLRRRRAVVLLTILGLAGILVILGFVVSNAAPPSAAAKAAAQQQVEKQAEQQTHDPEFQEQLKECQAAQPGGSAAASEAAPSATNGSGANGDGTSAASSEAATAAPGAPVATSSSFPDGSQWDLPPGTTCEDLMAPSIENYLYWSPPDYVSGFDSNLTAVTMFLALALALAGVTFAGADWSAGTIGTQLLYEPRRTRVFLSKAGAVAIVGLVVGAIGAALAWVVSYAVAAKWGSTEMVQQMQTFASGDGFYGSAGLTPSQAPISGAELLAWAVRASTIVGLAAVGGYLLAMLFRSSMVAVAVMAGYGIAGEIVLRNLFQGLEPYLLSSHISAWLDGPNHIVLWPSICGGNSDCDPSIVTISVAGGGVYLAILLAVGLVVAGYLFARRDVD